MRRAQVQTSLRVTYIQWLGFVITLALLFGHAEADTDKLYWTDIRGIHRVDLDGGNMETPVPVPLVSPMGIAVDKKDGKIYWADSKTGKIQRANLDGTNHRGYYHSKIGASLLRCCGYKRRQVILDRHMDNSAFKS